MHQIIFMDLTYQIIHKKQKPYNITLICTNNKDNNKKAFEIPKFIKNYRK